MRNLRVIIVRGVFALSLALVLGACASAPKWRGSLEREFLALESGRSANAQVLHEACAEGATAACLLLGQSVRPERQLAILQGPTSPDRTVLSILTPQGSRFLYVVLVSGQAGDSQARVWKVMSSIERRGRINSKWQVDHLNIEGISRNVVYSLWAINEQGHVVDQREFKALDLEKTKPRIVVASCLDDGYLEEQRTAWVEVRQRQPDTIFLIGDNVYGDKYLGAVLEGAQPDGLWERYVHTRQAVDLYRWENLVPVFAVWDDHDYGRNSGDRTYKYKNEAREIFFSFFPAWNQAPWYELGPGVSSYLRAFGMEFSFLDDRTFRSPNNEKADQAHIGAEQFEWLKAKMAKSTKPLFLISGDQFFGGYHKFESWEGNHPGDFADFRRWLKTLSRPFMFISGDRHLTELLKVSREEVGRETFELTTSAIHARTFSNALLQHPTLRRLEGAAGPKNFAELIPESRGKDLDLKISVFGVGMGALYERRVVIKGGAK